MWQASRADSAPLGFAPAGLHHTSVVVQFGKEASQTLDYCVARNATLRAARPDPSLRKERLLKDDNQTLPAVWNFPIE
jgi:hypothetical protein